MLTFNGLLLSNIVIDMQTFERIPRTRLSTNLSCMLQILSEITQGYVIPILYLDDQINQVIPTYIANTAFISLIFQCCSAKSQCGSTIDKM